MFGDDDHLWLSNNISSKLKPSLVEILWLRLPSKYWTAAPDSQDFKQPVREILIVGKNNFVVLGDCYFPAVRTLVYPKLVAYRL